MGGGGGGGTGLEWSKMEGGGGVSTYGSVPSVLVEEGVPLCGGASTGGLGVVSKCGGGSGGEGVHVWM